MFLRLMSYILSCLCIGSMMLASSHKSSLDFKHAVARYMKHTNTHCISQAQRISDEKISYKKELKYLLENYEKLSTAALLSRIRSAHYAMAKQNAHPGSDVHNQYEQICSALLLICTQVFCGDMRNQILGALHEIDNLMQYWRYQQCHQVRYFFSKSPHKWIMGKKQEQEIAHNIIRLERKQRTLYTLLGALTEHMHSFTEIGLDYNECYEWIEQLFEVTACIKAQLPCAYDATRFEEIASLLEGKIKKVSKFKKECLMSIAASQKPGHFTRNWITYAATLGSMAYAAHFYINNAPFVNALLSGKMLSLRDSWIGFVVEPTADIWYTIFGKKEEPTSKIEQETTQKSLQELLAKIDELEVKEGVNKETSNAFKKYLDKDIKNTRTMMQELLKGKVDEGKLTQDQYNEIIEAEKIGDVSKFQKLLQEMDKDLWSLFRRDEFLDAVVILAELKIYHYGSSMIQVVFELIVDYGMPVVREVLMVLAKGNKEWESAYKKVNLILNVAVLTPTIIVSLVGFNGLHKFYKWSTKRDYSPIRIALADTNSLLIEAYDNLDDHDYGKLVYLVSKLKHRAVYLKDSLADEFLMDVSKLESKQYPVQVKRGIAENMFNKYAFLGRIAA